MGILSTIIRNVSGTKDEAPRNDNTFDYTDSDGYRANQKSNEGIPSLGAPTLSELKFELDNIDDQLEYWKGIREAANATVSQCGARLKAAREIEVETAFAKGRDARHDRETALNTIERVTVSLEFAQKRLRCAEGQIKTWTKRKEQFPYDELKRLRTEDERRDRMRGKLRASSASEVSLDHPLQ
jgi:hypothetical protein